MDGRRLSMRKNALSRRGKIAKLRAHMTGEKPLRSEGAELAVVLEELQRENQVREISGWDSGFAKLNGALDGLLPGLYVLIGPPGIGKTAFAKQLLDQTAERNRAPAIFFSFAGSKKELRIKTLARLSGLDHREIRRGSAYLLHWYGVPRLGGGDAGQLPPSWEKLKGTAEEAKVWLDETYLVECQQGWRMADIEAQAAEVTHITGREPALIVIDDCQRLGAHQQSLEARLPLVVEQAQRAAVNLRAPLIAVWPDLDANSGIPPQRWGERCPGADAVLVMEKDLKRSEKLSEPNQAMVVHIVKNRGGEKGRLAFDFQPGFSRFREA